MKQSFIFILVQVLLLAVPVLSYSQYFEHLHDYDSLSNWGLNILLRPDGNYFTLGGGYFSTNNGAAEHNMIISNNGSVVLTKKKLQYDSTFVSIGDQGQAKKYPSGGYVVPITFQKIRGTYFSSRSGILKCDDLGDTVFVRTFTDTAIYFDLFHSCSIVADGGILLGGAHGTNIPAVYPGYIARTDIIGDTLWTHTYSAVGGQNVEIKNVFEIDGVRIAAGGFSRYIQWVGTTAFYHYTPWFMLLDSAGTIIRDTLYGARYAGGGALFKDMNGGYIHYGRIDSIPIPDAADDPRNFPFYVAHLDTNFRMTWITDLTVSAEHGQRQVFGIKQLRDSNFIAFGDDTHNGMPFIDGWAAKISRSGTILWNHYYLSDTANEGHIRDMIEKPDGSLVFIGSSFNDTLPAWRQRSDLWIIGVDSNGCEIPGCSLGINTGINTPLQELTESIQLWPNPTTGGLTLQAQEAGVLYINSMEGRVLEQYTIDKGNTPIQLPASLAAGIYMAVYTPVSGSRQQTVRFVYQP